MFLSAGQGPWLSGLGLGEIFPGWTQYLNVLRLSPFFHIVTYILVREMGFRRRCFFKLFISVLCLGNLQVQAWGLGLCSPTPQDSSAVQNMRSPVMLLLCSLLYLQTGLSFRGAVGYEESQLFRPKGRCRSGSCDWGSNGWGLAVLTSISLIACSAEELIRCVWSQEGAGKRPNKALVSMKST